MDAVPVISNLSVELAVVRAGRAGSSALRLRALAIKPASPKHVNGFIQPNAHRLELGQITVSLLSQTTIVDVTFDRIAVISVCVDAVVVTSNLSVELAVVRAGRAGSSALRLRALAIKPASPKHVNGFIQPNAHRLEQGQITVSLLSQTTIVDVTFDQIAVISVCVDAVVVTSNLSVELAVVRA